MSEQRTQKELREALAREAECNEELSREVLDLKDRLNDLVAGLELWNRVKTDDWDDLDEMLWRWVAFERGLEAERNSLPDRRDALSGILALLKVLCKDVAAMSREGGEGQQLNLRLAADKLRSAQRRIERAREI